MYAAWDTPSCTKSPSLSRTGGDLGGELLTGVGVSLPLSSSSSASSPLSSFIDEAGVRDDKDVAEDP